jgi:hypothetical protein
MTWRTVLSGLGLVAFVAFGAMSFGQRLLLVATATRIDVVDRPEPDPEKEEVVVGTIERGGEVPVIGCVDVKHYIAPQVRLASGAEGFVVVGEFKLKRQSPWSWSSHAPLVFGC